MRQSPSFCFLNGRKRYQNGCRIRKENLRAMSHMVTIQTKVRDPIAVAAACQRLNLTAPTQGTAQLYSGEAAGLLVQLPDWAYPVVVDTTTGVVQFDNFNGAWGEQQHLDRFMQAYAVEKAKLECRLKGYQSTETALQDGSIKLHIMEGS